MSGIEEAHEARRYGPFLCDACAGGPPGASYGVVVTTAGGVWLADVPVTDGWVAAVAVITPLRHELVLLDGRAPDVGEGRHALR